MAKRDRAKDAAAAAPTPDQNTADGQAEPEAAAPPTAAAPQPSKPRLFRLTKDGVWSHPTHGMMRVKRGKIFDARFFDLALLRKCGLELEEIR